MKKPLRHKTTILYKSILHSAVVLYCELTIYGMCIPKAQCLAGGHISVYKFAIMLEYIMKHIPESSSEKDVRST